MENPLCGKIVTQTKLTGRFKNSIIAPMVNPLEILNDFHGISIIEKSDKKFYLAFFVVKKKEEGDIEIITGNFVTAIFAASHKEAANLARSAETDQVELLNLVNVKDALLSSAAQAQPVPLVRGSNRVM